MAVVPAAGRGRRSRARGNKVLLPLAGKPVLLWSVKALVDCVDVSTIVVCVHPDEQEEISKLLRPYQDSKPCRVVIGGVERQDSVRNALLTTDDDCEITLVHDAARPLVTVEIIHDVVVAAREHRAAVAAVHTIDTIKWSDLPDFVDHTLDRSHLFSAQTPQAFETALLKKAHECAERDGVSCTDDAALVERMCVPVKLVEGDSQNIKLTTPEDYQMADAMVKIRCRELGRGHARMGIGFDIHHLVDGQPLMLGGVTVPFDRGLKGHSDADVVLHALCDALLGAVGAGDIGEQFPDTDPAYKGIASMTLLDRTVAIVRECGFEPSNVDVTVVAQAPKLSQFKVEMCKNIASCLEINPGAVSVKATTADGLGFIGREEGIAAYAIAAVCPID